MFVVPWGDFTYVGTTDTDYDGPVDDPQCDASDVAYLLRALNGVLTEPVTEDDVVGTWAGLRPLLRTASSARTADLSRRHGVRVSEQRCRHDHRRQADDLPAHGVRHRRRGPATARGRSARARRTKRLPLLGGEDFTPGAPSNEPSLHEHLAGRYGTEAPAVLALVGWRPLAGRTPRARPALRPGRGRPRGPPRDGAVGRRRPLAADAGPAPGPGRVGRRRHPRSRRLLAPELGWDDAEIERQVASYRGLVEAERAASHTAAPAHA